jgi:hypothetical protein
MANDARTTLADPDHGDALFPYAHGIILKPKNIPLKIEI